MDESGIEPETSPMLRERATDYATRPICIEDVVLRAQVIPECLDNPNINSLREVTSCQNSLSD